MKYKIDIYVINPEPGSDGEARQAREGRPEGCGQGDVLLVCTLEVDGSPQTIRPESVCDRVMAVPTIILYPRVFTMVSAHVHDHLILYRLHMPTVPYHPQIMQRAGTYPCKKRRIRIVEDISAPLCRTQGNSSISMQHVDNLSRDMYTRGCSPCSIGAHRRRRAPLVPGRKLSRIMTVSRSLPILVIIMPGNI